MFTLNHLSLSHVSTITTNARSFNATYEHDLAHNVTATNYDTCTFKHPPFPFSTYVNWPTGRNSFKFRNTRAKVCNILKCEQLYESLCLEDRLSVLGNTCHTPKDNH